MEVLDEHKVGDPTCPACHHRPDVDQLNADFRSEIPAFVIKVKTIFERWQRIQYLATGKKTEPWDPSLCEPKSHSMLGDEEIEFDAEEIEEMRKDDIRQCTRDLLLMERAREWLLEDEKTGDGN